MEKTFVKKVLAVVLGISLFVMLVSLASLIMDAVLADDVLLLDSNNDYIKEISMFMKWTSVALVCAIVPTVLCYIFAYFGNGKIFNICAAVLSFFVAAGCIAFIFVVRDIAMEEIRSDAYAAATGYISELVQLGVSTVISGIFFTVNSVVLFLNKKQAVNDAEVGNEEV